MDRIRIMTALVLLCLANGIDAASRPPLAQDHVKRLIESWVRMWNDYDLNQVDRLFLNDQRVTYFSSEKNGVIRGIEALRAHHAGFGFVPGGVKRDARLWLEGVHCELSGPTAVATAVWFFERGSGRRQSGPVTFVVSGGGRQPRFVHLHFANALPEIPPKAQAVSLLGWPLVPPALDEPVRREYDENLRKAKEAYERDPGDADALIWFGRRVAYLGDYTRAVGIFSDGIVAHPGDPRLFRHRGHRSITLRRFDRAIVDLERAARLIAGTPDQVEADGMPNAQNVPLSTLHTNIWYHLGLAYYLSGDFACALEAYEKCLKACSNDDMVVATGHWCYMTLRRLGREAEASRLLEKIHRDMTIIENQGYRDLLLFYKGELGRDELLKGNRSWIDDPAVQYGLGNWCLYNGKPDEARQIFRKIVKATKWATFGHIAAEAELSRL